MDHENIASAMEEAKVMEAVVTKAPSKGLKGLGVAAGIVLAGAALVKFVIVPKFKKDKAEEEKVIAFKPEAESDDFES